MTRILISESHPEVRRLLVQMVERLGHEPVVQLNSGSGFLDDVDLLIVEPADPLGGVLAKTARILDPLLPVICASVAAPPQIDVEFNAWLVKPFTLAQLADAVDRSLKQPRALPPAT